MAMFGLCGYFWNAVPGCIGANRHDRIPSYLRRSLLLITLTMSPFMILQFFSGDIMTALGVPPQIADNVLLYCQLMTVSTVLNIFGSHLEQVFIALGYAKCATFNSLVAGLGVDVVGSYFLIFKYSYGVKGAAWTSILVKLARVLIWLFLACYFKLWGTIFGRGSGEKLLSWTEFKIFIRIGLPSILQRLAGWLIFELQIMALANIRGITRPALAAGAVWVQCESSLASIQAGW
jgi:Na+-driven multidrug efflux pump